MKTCIEIYAQVLQFMKTCDWCVRIEGFKCMLCFLTFFLDKFSENPSIRNLKMHLVLISILKNVHDLIIPLLFNDFQ